MKNWMANRVPGLLVLAIIAVPVVDSGLWSDAAASGPDRDPPVIMVQTAETLEAGAPLIINAQIVDPSGIGPVVLWVRGEREDEFTQVPMERVGDDHVQVELQPWPGQGSFMAYYIEARDGKGNGPGYAGAPRTPYIIKFQGVPPAPVEAKTNWALRGVTAVALIVLVGGYFMQRRSARDRIHAELNAELNRLTGIEQETEVAANAAAREPLHSGPKTKVPQSPADQAFWIGLLSPVTNMDGRDRERALMNITVRAQHHPTLGKRFFDVGTLTRHLEWVERGDIVLTVGMATDERRSVMTEDIESSRPN